MADCRCDSNSQRFLIGTCLQLSADFDYTSSVKGFRKVDLHAFWLLFGEIWGPVISPVLIQKNLGTYDALLDIICAGQMELDMGGELALVQIDFSAAFDRANHGGLVFILREAGVGGMILKVFKSFLSSHTQRVDGVCSSSIDVVSGVPQGSVLDLLLFLLYIADLPGLLQNELVGYADDSTLLCRIPHPRDRSSLAASLNDDLAMISDWCSRCGGKSMHDEGDAYFSFPNG